MWRQKSLTHRAATLRRQTLLSTAFSIISAGIFIIKVNTTNPATTNATASPTHAYNYDSAGNRTSSLDNGLITNYSSNSVNEYTNISGGGFQLPSQNPTYDPNGNMLVAASVSGAVSYSYDRENRLRTITTGTDTVSHTYDALGRLIQTETPAATDNRERYTWAGWTLLTREIFTASGTTTTSTSTHRYTWGLDLSGSMEGAGGVGGLLAIERNVTGNNTWDIRYPHYDANGNIIALSDQNGNISARYRYDAFGKTLEATDLDNSGWSSHNIHGFSTKPYIAATGLLYYGYRHYAPQLGRWINRDPIEEKGGVNLYGFVGNDGVGHLDLLGKKSKCFKTTYKGDKPGSPQSGQQRAIIEGESPDWYISPHKATLKANMELTIGQSFREIIGGKIGVGAEITSSWDIYQYGVKTASYGYKKYTKLYEVCYGEGDTFDEIKKDIKKKISSAYSSIDEFIDVPVGITKKGRTMMKEVSRGTGSISMAVGTLPQAGGDGCMSHMMEVSFIVIDPSHLAGSDQLTLINEFRYTASGGGKGNWLHSGIYNSIPEVGRGIADSLR